MNSNVFKQLVINWLISLKRFQKMQERNINTWSDSQQQRLDCLPNIVI